jgi:hypothetical protein
MARACLHVRPFSLEVVHKIIFIYQLKRVEFIAPLLGYQGANDSFCVFVSMRMVQLTAVNSSNWERRILIGGKFFFVLAAKNVTGLPL